MGPIPLEISPHNLPELSVVHHHNKVRPVRRVRAMRNDCNGGLAGEIQPKEIGFVCPPHSCRP